MQTTQIHPANIVSRILANLPILSFTENLQICVQAMQM